MGNRFSKQLSELRLESKLSRAQLAEKLNVSVRLISYWENGQRECDFDMLIKIADLFSVSIDYLLGRTDY
ncbi:MAG: helix-turn-helix transcriptional regulator [Clostridia bacterium]|nr:helix-turn-helix transcriptional regulator [Clostridia bacterium]